MSVQNTVRQKTIDCDLAVIGAGMAGMAASALAAKRGVSVVQIGRIESGILFASGLLDLMAVHPIAEKKLRPDPWAAIEALAHDIPNHPYARIKKDRIHSALDEMISFFKEAGYTYCHETGRNVRVLTGQGTVKHTYYVPRSMWAGVEALEKKEPCLIIGFRGLKEFSAQQVARMLEDKWPALRSMTVTFPNSDHRSEVFSAHMARFLELHKNRKEFAELIKPNIKDAKAVGMPAILGINRTEEILSFLEQEFGVPVFEIPTMPASVPGLRFKELFEKILSAKDIRQYFGKVKTVSFENDGNFLIPLEENELTVRAKGIILATGRFMSKGLVADRIRVREPIFDLPVTQPSHRKYWHTVKFMDPAGHQVDRAGLDIDNDFRPLDKSGNPVYHNLFAAGSILAHQDWKRMKCGSGLAFATAYAAVRSFIDNVMLAKTKE